MNKKVIRILLWLFILPILTAGQTREIDSLKKIVNSGSADRLSSIRATERLWQAFVEIHQYDSGYRYAQHAVRFVPDSTDRAAIDTNVVNLLIGLGGAHQFKNLDSAIMLSSKALAWARQIHFRSGEGWASMTLGENYRLHGDFTRALELLLDALRISREINDAELETHTLLFTGTAYSALGAYRTGLQYMQEGISRADLIRFPPMIPFIWSNIGDAYEKLDQLDSALVMQEKAAQMVDSMMIAESSLRAAILGWLGLVHARMGNTEKALGYYRASNHIRDYLNLCITQYLMADLFYKNRKLDSSLYYGRLGYVNSINSSQQFWKQESCRLLASVFADRGMMDSAYHYQRQAFNLRDSMFSPQKFNALQLAAINDQQNRYDILQKKQEAEQEREMLASRIKVWSLLAALAVFLLIALILYRNNRQKHLTNLRLEQQKGEITEALSELKATQAQLVQSEKMASLGELTAGIAHEIQNPLNFVNNFSDLNRELIDELQEELKKGDVREASSIAENLKDNEAKINLHGKRADGIVKSMLQHSRINSGIKEPTDLNKLTDEYLRLAFHGMRAKDKSFNVTLDTDYEPNLPLVPVVAQDIGRVLLNLFNNAFYAVNEKKKSAGPDYQPTVTVSTRMLDDTSGIPSPTMSNALMRKCVIVRVADNGPGIPDAIREKIFQPFFTTKPTGQGTGLGLSLSYDIVKANGGSLTLEKSNDEGCRFTIILAFA